MAQVDARLLFSGTRVLRVALPVALLGWLGLAAGLATHRSAVFFGYLTAFAFTTSVALGALILLMINYVVGARWHIVIRRLNETIASVFPALAVLFVPLVFGLDELYLWADPPRHLASPEVALLQHKQPYLNAPFFIARTAFYFLVWIVAAVLLRRWSLSQDGGVESRQRSAHGRERALSAAFLPFVALALTFAAFDWLMSLQPFWVSSMFGVYYFAGGFVASFGLLALLAFAVQRTGMARDMIRPPHFHALGRLMFAFTVFWAYSAYFQAMLIQIANRPEEAEFFVHRLGHGWDYVLAAVVLARFALPFALLLPRAIKFNGAAMAAIGAWIVLGHYLDVYWLVAPIAHEHGAFVNAWDVFAVLAVVGSTVSYAAFLLRGKPVVPIGDPNLQLSIRYRSPL